ncbi:hypothetical protein [Streptomyces albus]|uniref:hypothetical protein n=1 Tax=Streptomyces albus TaxID=1888 RepID=UPI001A9BDB16|nr:hypothetical protein [Streptomyces albus]
MQGRTLFVGVLRPGRMHDQTAGRTEGVAEQFHRHPKIKTEVEEGYRGLANEFSGQDQHTPELSHPKLVRPGIGPTRSASPPR